MALSVQIITGPSSAKLSKEAAAEKLEKHPLFVKDATYELEEVEGRWIAAIATETTEKTAEFPPGADDAALSPDGPPAPEDGPPADDGAESDHADGEDKPDGDKPKDHDKGEGGELGEIKHLLTTLLTALGLDPAGQEGSPVPGLDEGPPAPPAGPPGPGSDEKTHTVHERALKPGEAPPGSTPVGAPAFASVRDDHPWKNILGQKKTFKVEEQIGDLPISAVASELKSLAAETGKYRVAQLVEGRDDSGQRVASALISA